MLNLKQQLMMFASLLAFVAAAAWLWETRSETAARLTGFLAWLSIGLCSLRTPKRADLRRKNFQEVRP